MAINPGFLELSKIGPGFPAPASRGVASAIPAKSVLSALSKADTQSEH